jgi:pimeloyl-ACP methyl ester carboxylesterase
MTIYRSPGGARAVERRYRELLAHWPVPCERLTVPTRHGDTFVVASGPPGAPPLIALHGSGTNAAMWLPQIRPMAAHLRVYAVDIIGEPGLSAPTRPPLGSGAYAHWLDDVLDALGLAEAPLLGVSLGGWLAIDYATRRPERVTRLALVAPSGVGRRRPGVMVAALLLMPFGDRGRRRTLRLALGPALPRPAGPALRATDARRAAVPETAGALAGLATDFPLLVFKHFKPRLAVPVFADEALGRLTMPVLAVLGGRDAMLDSHQTARRLSAVVPHAAVTLVPEAGHYPPDQTANMIDFLRDTGRVSHA